MRQFYKTKRKVPRNLLRNHRKVPRNLLKKHQKLPWFLYKDPANDNQKMICKRNIIISTMHFIFDSNNKKQFYMTSSKKNGTEFIRARGSFLSMFM